ncbi:MAG: hypothetical protein CMN32_16060 [Saprospirales bacterium]|nr:hypothetical protein [Saprospirales bacterium]
MSTLFTRLWFLLPFVVAAPFWIFPSAKRTSAPVPVTLPVVDAASPPPCNCTVTQGTFTAPLPYFSSNTSAVNFYNYGNPAAASANTGLEMSETMLIMIYEDITTQNTSLIIILDQANDGTGGNATIDFSCMPSSAFVEFSDDGGELSGSPPNITGNFNWAGCCTDGGIIGGFTCGSNITINPDITSGINAFSLVYGSPANPIYTSMPMLNCPITVNCGGPVCCDQAFEFSAAVQNATCDNSPTGSIDLTTDCASAPQFMWSNGMASEDLFGLYPGAYTVTITDINGCSQAETYTVMADSPAPQPVINGPTEFCEGDIVELGVSGNYIAYQWSTGSPNSLILVTDPGTYTVTVTNASGCTGVASTTLTQNPSPQPDISGPSTICVFGDTITLDAGGGYTAYQWSTGEVTQSIELTDFGGYFVTVTNSYGCTNFDFHLVDPVPNPFPEITGPESLCPGESILLDAGSGYNSYSWSTGASSQSISPPAGGNYTVTVTNGYDCEGTASIEVTEYPADTILLFQTSCNPADTGVFIGQYQNQYGCDSLEILTITYSESDSVFLFDQSCNPQDTGIFTQTFTNQYGCDSVEVLTVSLLPADSVFVVANSCNPQDTGVVVQTFMNQFGCDSVVTTTTLLLPSDTTELFQTSCDPANAGVVEEIFTNQYGCDSLVITTTTYVLADTTYLGATTCDPAAAGIFEEQYTGSSGCDSIVITTVELLPSDTTYLQATTCDENQAGISEEILSNLYGCDSLIITNTTYIPPDSTFLNATTCDPAAAGTAYVLLQNSYGCDSVIVTNTALLPSDTTELFQTSCDPNQVGTEAFLFNNQYGCDSLVIIQTSFAPADSTSLSTTTCDPGLVGDSVEVFTSTDGCDSVVTTTTTLLPSDTVMVFAESCDPSDVGTTQQLFNNQYGCDSLVITTTSLLPSDTTYLQATTCDENQAGISEVILSNQYGCDSLIITNTTFIPPDSTFLNATTCDPAAAGISYLVLQNSYGCDSVIVTNTALLPSDTTILQAWSCDPAQVGISQVILTNQFGCDSTVITETGLLPSDTTWLFFGSCLPADTGLVVQQYSNQYGCDSTVFLQTDLLPATACQLNALAVGDTIGCNSTTGSISVTLFDGSPPYQYTWTEQNGASGSGTFDQTGSANILTGLPPGNYSIEITDPDGLSTTLNATVFQPAPLSIQAQPSSDYNGYRISCPGASDGSAIAVIAGGGLPPFSIQWSDGQTTPQAENLAAGWHNVTVTGATGCEAVDSVFLNSPPALAFGFSTQQPDCFSQGYGSISIENVTGGVPPYQYSLDLDSYTDLAIFEGLPQGSYQPSVMDANGCVASQNASIGAYQQLFVYLGADVSIPFGDSVLLAPVISPLPAVEEVVWEGVDRPGCFEVVVAPQQSSSFVVTIFDSLGCSATDTIWVEVEKNFDVFVPNAFSPNHDGVNDLFMIYSGPQVVKVRQLQVFDRWGEPVFTYFNFPPNDPTYGWNGTYRGKELDPAVFAWFAIVEFADGSTKVVKGDVVLMRK